MKIVRLCFVLLVSIEKAQVYYEERLLLVSKFNSLSTPASYELLLAVGGFTSATAAPRQHAEPRRLHSV
jgi:hypothetical protein